MPAGTAAAEVRSLRPSSHSGQRVTFNLRGVDADALRKAYLRGNGERQRLSVRKVRAAAQRGRLRIKVPRDLVPPDESARRAVRRVRLVVATDPVVLSAGDIASCDSTGDEATAALLDVLPGKILTAGDHVYESGTPEEFARCYAPTWGRQRARTFPTIGDHEYGTPGASGYFDYFGSAAGQRGKGYYSFDIGSWHVVSLNTNCDQLDPDYQNQPQPPLPALAPLFPQQPPKGCAEGYPEEQWLKADLARHSARCTLAVLHNPRFSSGEIHGSSHGPVPFWNDLYARGAEIVLSGNDHFYERFAPQTPSGGLDRQRGIRQWVVGMGGRSHYPFAAQPQPNSEVRNNDTYGVLKLVLRRDSYSWRFMPQAGKTFSDSGSTPCH